MKAVVITLLDNAYSVRCAEKCVESAKKFDIKVEIMAACNASQVDVHKIFASHGLPSKNFYDKWSRTDKAMACFFSHYSAWALAEAIKEPLLILEHDAVFKKPVDLDSLVFDSIINLGKPSYGRFSAPIEKDKTGVRPFFSNPSGYLKGAHAYIVKPDAATKMIKLAKEMAGPADLYISTQNFHDLAEYYPWPVVVEESATTVQQEAGSKAKHAYGKNYKVI